MAVHTIVHMEIPTPDPAATSKFYGDLFGWQISHDPQFDYYMFRMTPELGDGGGFVTPDEHSQPGGVLVYIGTDDIEASLARAVELGGSLVHSKMEIPGTGWFGIFADPNGYRMAVFTPLPTAQEGATS